MFVNESLVNAEAGNPLAGNTVATPAPGTESEEKVDSMQLEFTYLLTSQLDTQREYYEDRLTRIEASIIADRQASQLEMETIKKANAALDNKLQVMTKEKTTVEKKVNFMNAK